MFISGSLSWSQLAINGLSSYGPSGVNAGNLPENHAGQTGSINVPDTTSTFTLLFASGLILIAFKRLQKLPKSLQPTRRGALDSSRRRGLFSVAVPPWLISR
jgi:hypothetical protein